MRVQFKQIAVDNHGYIFALGEDGYVYRQHTRDDTATWVRFDPPEREDAPKRVCSECRGTGYERAVYGGEVYKVGKLCANCGGHGHCAENGRERACSDCGGTGRRGQ